MTAPPPRLVLVEQRLLDLMKNISEYGILEGSDPDYEGDIVELRALLSSAPEAPSEEDVELVALHVSRFSVFRTTESSGAAVWWIVDSLESGKCLTHYKTADLAVAACNRLNARSALAALLAGPR